MEYTRNELIKQRAGKACKACILTGKECQSSGSDPESEIILLCPSTTFCNCGWTEVTSPLNIWFAGPETRH